MVQKSQTTTWDVLETEVNTGINKLPTYQLVSLPDFRTINSIHLEKIPNASVVNPVELRIQGSSFPRLDAAKAPMEKPPALTESLALAW